MPPSVSNPVPPNGDAWYYIEDEAAKAAQYADPKGPKGPKGTDELKNGVGSRKPGSNNQRGSDDVQKSFGTAPQDQKPAQLADVEKSDGRNEAQTDTPSSISPGPNPPPALVPDTPNSAERFAELDTLVLSLNEKNQAMYELEAEIISCAGLTATPPPLNLQEGDEVKNWNTLLKFRYELGKAVNQLPATTADAEAPNHIRMRACIAELDQRYIAYSAEFEKVRELDPDAYHAAKAISAIYTNAAIALAEVHPTEPEQVNKVIAEMANAFVEEPDQAQEPETERTSSGVFHSGRISGALKALEIACKVTTNVEFCAVVEQFKARWIGAQGKAEAERNAARDEVYQNLEKLLDQMVKTAREMAPAPAQAQAQPPPQESKPQADSTPAQ